jgi:hypothetical protein
MFQAYFMELYFFSNISPRNYNVTNFRQPYITQQQSSSIQADSSSTEQQFTFPKTVATRIKLRRRIACKILGFHGDDYEECLLG